MIESDSCVKKLVLLLLWTYPSRFSFHSLSLFSLILSLIAASIICDLKKGDHDSSSNEDSCAKRTKDHRNLRSMCVKRCGVIIIYGRGKVEGPRTRKEYQSFDCLERNGSTSHVGFHLFWM